MMFWKALSIKDWYLDVFVLSVCIMSTASVFECFVMGPPLTTESC